MQLANGLNYNLDPNPQLNYSLHNIKHLSHKEKSMHEIEMSCWLNLATFILAAFLSDFRSIIIISVCCNDMMSHLSK